MARRLPFHALTSPILRGCPWRTLLWSYVGAIRTSKQGHLSRAGMLWHEHQYLYWQGYHHREVSVPPLARIFCKEYQCYLEQGCFHRSISALHQPPKGRGVLTKNTSAPTQLMLLLLNYIWMTPDVVPTRVIHHRFLYWRNLVTWQCICVHGVRAKALGDSQLCTL